MSHTDALTSCTAMFVDELSRCGVENVCVSPGSRSTPLTILFNEHPDINLYINVDERSAAFFALGMAKATMKPVALVCTSGTAAANYYPAIIEARLSRIPLIVITSDRPHELRQVGAPQSIDQIKLYGDHVKGFVEMPIPEPSLLTSKVFRSQVRRMTMMAMSGPRGPVHINMPFREPLVPNIEHPDLWKNGQVSESFSGNHGVTALSDSEIVKIEQILQNTKRGLIIVGPETSDESAVLFNEIGKKYSIPVLADPLSQLRTGPHDKDWIIESYDAFLRDPDIKENFKPDTVLRFGPMPVSKPLLQLITSSVLNYYAVFDSEKEWLDPSHQATHMFYSETTTVLKSLLSSSAAQNPEQAHWGNQWRTVNGIARERITAFSMQGDWYEGQAVAELIATLPDKAVLFAGNSMPIRDVDTYLLNQKKSLLTIANRGANGIDGVVSSALGVAAVKKRVYLLIGDLSFFHDMNGLLIAKQYNINLTIIVINNNGGGIFSFLPQAESVSDFEKLFGTPADLDFSHVAKLYGAEYTCPDSWGALRAAIDNNKASRGLRIIEIKTNREFNTKLHRDLWKSTSQYIKECINNEDFN